MPAQDVPRDAPAATPVRDTVDGDRADRGPGRRGAVARQARGAATLGTATRGAAARGAGPPDTIDLDAPGGDVEGPHRVIDHVIDLTALESATQDLAHAAWTLERLTHHPDASADLRRQLEQLHVDLRAALGRHLRTLARQP